MNAPITAHNLQVCYGAAEVLHGIDLAIKAGEFVSIVGQSGSGKSTLLHALAEFVESRGKVEVPSRIGMVFQNYAVFPWLTVRGNIAFGLHEVDRETKAKKIKEHLELTRLEEHQNKYPAELSGGQSQRVALARALAPNPDAIFMDEPFGALDPHTQEKMETWLLDVWERDHKTVVFVTHNIEEAIFLSDRIIVLGAGNILGEYPVRFARPRLEPIKFTSEFLALKKELHDTLEK